MKEPCFYLLEYMFSILVFVKKFGHCITRSFVTTIPEFSLILFIALSFFQIQEPELCCTRESSFVWLVIVTGGMLPCSLRARQPMEPSQHGCSMLSESENFSALMLLVATGRSPGL